MINFNNRRVASWLKKVFGPESLTDVEERALRFGEESLELIEALGVTKDQAIALVNQVFDKGAPGEKMQELGGVCVTLASLCNVAKLDANLAYEIEFARCERPEIIAKIQEKHRTKAVVSARYG